MKLNKLIGNRFKEKPADCSIDSHALFIRGGYMKYMANGIYSSYLPLMRIEQKIMQIMREEMDRIDGQEVQFPVVMPASLWEQSGRYDKIGGELMRLKDRHQLPLVLGMTHEEAAVHLVSEYGKSYTKYPFMIYQIQTKFRDELRPRAGLIRVREFMMKDGYSFHTSQADLEQYYLRCLEAYRRIFTRAGIPEVVSVASDSGMMGGDLSHEFMLLTPVGEDSVVLCKECDYRANAENANLITEHVQTEKEQELTLVSTPEVKTIEALCRFLDTDEQHCCKALVYQKISGDELVIIFIRGDLELNETKLRNHLGTDVIPAAIEYDREIAAGYIGPYKLANRYQVLFDQSLKGRKNLVCGANKQDYHYQGLNIERDLGELTYFDFAKAVEGGICPQCRQPALTISKGIEVGNIFQLGTRYTETMNMTYTDADGTSKHPYMGCYGIGVGRLAATICEARHDDNGPIWPISTSPWQVHLCAIRSDIPEVKECADHLYNEFLNYGIEVIYDDRSVTAGIMFSDADLLGVPIRVVVSTKNLKLRVVEITTRDKQFEQKVPIVFASKEIQQLIIKLKHDLTAELK